MAPAIISKFLTSTIGDLAARRSDVASLGPLAARTLLLAREKDDGNSNDNKENKEVPGVGVIDPHDINNTALFALFGLIGVAFVVVGIWFFFWAKNGGFYFKETDWDDYKTTVLRRRGPNGTILSGATESTDLGGGSIYKDIDDGSTDIATTVVTDSTGLTGITGGVSDLSGREKRRRKRVQKEREKEKRREQKAREKEERKHGKSGRKVGADGILIDEEAEAEAEEHLRSYRHERPARVGGLNKESDGSAWDGSTNPSNSTATGSGVGGSEVYGTETGTDVTSGLMNNREHTLTSTPKKKGGIRKVYSTADKNATREAERVRAEARRLQEKGRAARAESSTAPSSSRRDFSWQRADDSGLRRIEEASSVGGSSSGGTRESHVPGSWVGSEVGTGSDVGTKVYRHSVHIPGTASSDFAYAEEKRNKRRNGASYRRGGDDGR